jgi:hypothetical protein
MKNKTIAIVQSNYIPWRGYFDIIRHSDEFIIGDNVQYTKQDWRNRNRIKTSSGVVWLTIAVAAKGRISTSQRIDETRVADPGWCAEHLRLLTQAYRKAPHFEEVAAWLFPLFREIANEPLLTVVNVHLLRGIAARLGIATPILRPANIEGLDQTVGGRTEGIVAMCKATGATRYLSGLAAKSYLDERMLQEIGVTVEWIDYSGYPEYPQLWGEFDPQVSIIDPLFNTGSDAARFLDRRPG